MNNEKIKIFKWVLLIITTIALIGTTIYLFPVVKDLATKEGQVVFKEKINSLGILGYLVLFLLQFAQIFLFIIPGEPIEVLAGLCYGAIFGTIFIMISACVISATIFWLVRKYGRKFIYSFCDKEKIAKIENSNFFKNTNKVEIIMYILFFIPGTPKDLLVYISGLFPVNFVRFILISTIARFPSVITSTLVGANLSVGDWEAVIIIYLCLLAMVIIGALIANKMSRQSEKKD